MKFAGFLDPFEAMKSAKFQYYVHRLVAALQVCRQESQPHLATPGIKPRTFWTESKGPATEVQALHLLTLPSHLQCSAYS